VHELEDFVVCIVGVLFFEAIEARSGVTPLARVDELNPSGELCRDPGLGAVPQ